MLVEHRTFGKKRGESGIQITIVDRTTGKSKSMTVKNQTLKSTYDEIYFYYRAKYNEEIKELWRRKYGKKTTN